MDRSERDAVVEQLELMVRCEDAVGAFYGACAAAWPPDRDFWLELADEEGAHALRLELLKERVRDVPAVIRVNRRFPRAALEVFLAGVNEHRAQVLGGMISQLVALALARDLERSLIESQALRAIALGHPAWRLYLNALSVETREHQQRVEERFAREVAAPAA